MEGIIDKPQFDKNWFKVGEVFVIVVTNQNSPGDD